ncbi:sugar MFS transporter [Geothrix sp. 21YS21S-4]|uniref:MFS transporter n=1 Tax=Geothrix sp. 21YS21S-4 TaxID=3068889 RepID=UPI0027BA53DC|nr:MFS transporter [Geothrix sp. 21YS21S-4]
MRLRTFPVFLAFLVMGIADAMGPMADGVRAQYHLSHAAATLLTFSVFIAFAAFSVPAGLLAARIGRKRMLVLGLGMNAAAILVPILALPSFGVLLGCIFVLGAGTTFLQVAGNPIMRDVSAPGAYPRNLALAQGIKGLGSASSAYLVGLVAILPVFSILGWRGVFPVFFVLMALALVLMAGLKVEESQAEVPPSLASSLALLKDPAFLFAVLGIFLYVGAEVCMARFLKPALAGFGWSEDRAALLGPTLFFALLTVGRLAAGLLPFSARAWFRLSAGLGLIGALCLMAGTPRLSLAGVILGGLGFANIWPMLFALTVERRPERASELSGLMCMAISGGAGVPLLMGRLSDLGFGGLAFAVPAACFLFLAGLAFRPAVRAEA